MSNKDVQTPAGSLQSGPGKKNTIWDDFLEVIKELPWGVGPFLVFTARRLGAKHFLLIFVALLTGIISGWAVVYIGLAPDFVVSDKYKRGAQKADASLRTTPRSIEVTPVGEPNPDWLQPYVGWIEEEGQAQKDVEATLHVGSGAVFHVLQSPTTEFVWSLRASPGFELEGRAFRVTDDGLIQPLKSSKDGNSIDFDVPECEKKESLYAVVMAKWRGEMSPPDIQSTFKSIIKQGR